MDKIAQEIVEEYKSYADKANFLSTLFKERSQLYGALIIFMLAENLSSFPLNEGDLKKASNYLLLFEPHGNDKSVTIKLMEGEYGVGRLVQKE